MTQKQHLNRTLSQAHKSHGAHRHHGLKSHGGPHHPNAGVIHREGAACTPLDHPQLSGVHPEFMQTVMDAKVAHANSSRNSG